MLSLRTAPADAAALAYMALLAVLLGAHVAAEGCRPLTPAEVAGLDGAFAALCPLEGLADPALVVSCPGQEALVNAALVADEQGVPTPPGTSVEAV